MSLHLKALLQQPVPIHAVLEGTRQTLFNLLDTPLDAIFSLEVEEVEQGVHTHLRTSVIDRDSPVWLFGWGLHRIELLCYSHADSLREELGDLFSDDMLEAGDERAYAYVTVRGLWHTPDSLKWALAAACAVALAREVGSSIIDEALAWSSHYEQRADEFLAAVKREKAEELAEGRRALREELQRDEEPQP